MATSKRVSPELQRLRELAKKDRAAATQKIYRIRKNQHVDLTGTEYDPRRPVAVINKYNAAQLRGYIAKLEQFSDRGAQYIAGSNGVAIPKGLYSEYKRLESVYNALVDLRNAERAPYILPGEGNKMTIGEREQYMLPDNLRMRNAAANSLYPKQDINPANVAGEFGLKELIKDIKLKLKPGYLKKEIKGERVEVEAMLKTIGDKVTIKSIRGLSNHQFDVLFNSTKFVRSVSRIYEFYKNLSADAKEEWYNTRYQDEVSELNEAIEWARNLPTDSAFEMELYRRWETPNVPSDDIYKKADIDLNEREYNKAREVIRKADKLESDQEAKRQNREYYKEKNVNIMRDAGNRRKRNNKNG
jgi:hypothetical protein